MDTAMLDLLHETMMLAMAGPNGEDAIKFIRTVWPDRNTGHGTHSARDTRNAIKNALIALRFVRGRGEHTHKCGHIDADESAKTDMLEADGCGFVWTHDEADIKSSAEHDAAHTCPRCGKGPWYLQYRNQKGHYVLADGTGCSLREPLAA